LITLRSQRRFCRDHLSEGKTMTIRFRTISTALLALALGGCAKAGPVLAKGACADFYGSQVCSWTATQGNTVIEAGIDVPVASIEKAPAEASMAWPPVAAATLALPEPMTQQTGFTHLTVYWEPMGHPPGPYLTPHFDFHFYSISDGERMAIDCSDVSKPAAMPAAYALPDVPLPPDMAKALGVPVLIGLCVPQMGMHAMPSDKLEGSTPFDGSMVIGYYAGKPIFTEPMLSKAMLLERKSFDLPIPAVPGLAGPHPTKFQAEYNAKEQSYRFIFSGFSTAS
jgi:hypothetical protein